MLKTINKNNIYDYLVCGLILFLPYSLKFPNLFLIVIALFFILDFKSYKTLNFDNVKTITFSILASLILYIFTKGLFTNSLSETKYGLLLPIVVIPFLLLKVTDFKKVFIAIVLTGFLTASYANFGLIMHYLTHNKLLPFEGGNINQILNMERPYLGFLLVFSLIISFMMTQIEKKYRFVFYGYSIYAGLSIFLISARISLLTIIILVTLYLVFYLKISLKFKLFFGLIIVSIMSIILYSNKSLQERLFLEGNFEDSLAKFSLYEPRLIIWPCAYEISQQEDFNVITGISSEKKLDELMVKCYDHKISNKHRANFYVESEFNTHNQFLGMYMTSGIIGMILLMMFFIVQLYIYRTDFVRVALIVSLVMFFMVENVMHRQLGVYLFILCISIINIVPLKVKKNL